MASSRRLLLAALGLAAQAVSFCAGADEPLPAPPALQAELVKTGLYLIRGGGGNSLLRFSMNGMVLVNGKSPGSYKPLMSQVHKINKLGDLPLRVLILTDMNDAEAANSAQFAAAHVPILVQANAADRLADTDARLVTYEQAYTVKLGGIEVQVKHFGNAPGNADAVVLFPDMKVIAVGDLYTPELAAAEAAGLSARSAVLAEVLALDFEQVVPNSGPVISRAELEAFKRRIDALTLHAASN